MILLLKNGLVHSPLRGSQIEEVGEELFDELQELAAWLGLERIDIKRRGDLADALRLASTGARHRL